MHVNQEEFWDRLEDIRTGMLELADGFNPMTHSLEPEDGNLWFLAANGSGAADAAKANAASRYVVANDREGIYADIHGQLSVSTDRKVLEQVWSPMARTWFEDDINDPDIVLIRFTPARARVWLGPESGLEGLIALAKARFGGETEDLGRQFDLVFTV